MRENFNNTHKNKQTQLLSLSFNFHHINFTILRTATTFIQRSFS